MSGAQGMVFDIQHFTLHDGPGVRSTVFLKGCPLACWWCSNPESQNALPQLMFFKDLCTACGACLKVCPHGALSLESLRLVMNRGTCTACGACVEICPNNARQLSGRLMTVQEVLGEVRQHWRIFQQSGGGVTCSGGEALAQQEFLMELFKGLHDEVGLHTCLDTCGMAPWSSFKELLPYVDLVLLDIKHMDSAIHKHATRAGNDLVLANARELAKRKIPVLIRVPLIPGFNDTDMNLNTLGAFLKENALTETEIMPYHTLGLNKYAALDKTYAYHADTSPRVEVAVQTLESYGLSVLVHQN